MKQPIGLQRGTVVLTPYNPDWPKQYKLEEAVLRAIFGNSAVAIEHVGSTAVPGLSAKPIVDIAVGLRHLADWTAFVEPLQAAGYTCMPDRVSDTEVFMPKGPEANRTHYLHITGCDTPEWRNMLTFRDALRANENLSVQYQVLKQQLATQFPGDRQSYSAGKAEFIQKVIQS